MTGTFYATDLLQTGAGFVVSGLLGILFGMFLEQAGFGSSRKLTAVFYFKDMTVIKVMFTAVVVALVGYQYLVAFGWLNPAEVHMLDTYWLSQAVGGLIFGAGFVMGGWCPGTALVGIASAKWDALLFLGGVVLGTIFFNELFPLIRSVYEGTAGGGLFLYDSLGISSKALVFYACMIAVAMFVLCSWIEGRSGHGSLGTKNWKAHGLAGVILFVFAGGVFLLGEPPAQSLSGGLRSGYLAEIVDAEDHMEPLELAQLMMKGATDLVVVDLRSLDDFQAFHLKGAISIPLESLTAEADSRLPRGGRIVLYSNGTTHAAQAWLQMRQWGWTNVRVLTDGIVGFWRECLTPPSLSAATDENVARAELSGYRERMAYFY